MLFTKPSLDRLLKYIRKFVSFVHAFFIAFNTVDTIWRLFFRAFLIAYDCTQLSLLLIPYDCAVICCYYILINYS